MKMKTKLTPMHKLIVLAVILSIMGFKHPMHVTVTEVEFDKTSRTVEMSMHVFSDDLEKYLKLIERDEELDITELSMEAKDQLLNAYFVEQVSLKINGKDFTPSYLGHKVEGDAIWVFLEVQNIKKIKILEITNTTLFDLYDDQANLIHFEYEGEIYSEKLDSSRTTARYELENL